MATGINVVEFPPDLYHLFKLKLKIKERNKYDLKLVRNRVTDEGKSLIVSSPKCSKKYEGQDKSPGKVKLHEFILNMEKCGDKWSGRADIEGLVRKGKVLAKDA